LADNADKSSSIGGRAIQPIEDRITELWRHIVAAAYRFLQLVAEFDR
jgi:hypothetical protein